MFRELEKGKKYASPNNRTDPHTCEQFEDAEFIFKDLNLIVVDLDGLGQDLARKIAKELHTKLVKTKYVLTDNGLHIYFKKPLKKLPNTTVKNFLGLNTEYKKEKVVVKRNGKDREVLYNDEPPIMPFEFHKHSKSEDNTLFGLVDGEGRHNKLFNHLVICSYKLDIEALDFIKHFINNYVFAEPKTKESIEAMNIKDNSEEKSTLTAEILEFIDCNRDKIVVYNMDIYVKYPTWTNDLNVVNNYLITHFNKGQSNTREIEELKKQIQYRTLSKKTGDYREISFKNGYITDNELIVDLENSNFTPYYFNCEYVKDSHNEHLHKIMKLISNNDNGVINYLYDICALSLCTNREIRKRNPLISILIGTGGNGKGIYLDLISNIFENNNISAVMPDEHKDTSKRHQLLTSLINLGDDISDRPFSAECLSDLKSISMLEKVTTRALYQSSITVEPITSVIYTSNHIPTFFERGAQITRRFKFVEFNNNLTDLVTNNELTPAFFRELRSEEVKNAFFSKVVDRLMLIQKNGTITYPKSVLKYTEEFFKDNDYITLFMEFVDIPAKVEETLKCIDLYTEFNEFLYNEMGVKNEPITQITFNKQLSTRLKTEIEKIKKGGVAFWRKR